MDCRPPKTIANHAAPKQGKTKAGQDQSRACLVGQLLLLDKWSVGHQDHSQPCRPNQCIPGKPMSDKPSFGQGWGKKRRSLFEKKQNNTKINKKQMHRLKDNPSNTHTQNQTNNNTKKHTHTKTNKKTTQKQQHKTTQKKQHTNTITYKTEQTIQKTHTHEDQQ